MLITYISLSGRVGWGGPCKFEFNLAATVGAAAVAVAAAAQGRGYILDSIGFQITLYDMPSTYYSAVASVLECGSIF